MNKLIKSVALSLAASSMLASSVAMAADQKIAVVNVQAVVSQLPQTALIQEALKNEFKDQISAFEKLQGELKYNLEKQQRDGPIMSKADMDALIAKIEEQKVQYQQQGTELQQSMGRRENEEKNKVFALIRQAIDNIAEKDKYDLVLQQTAVAFAKPDYDISKSVIEQVSKLK